jgi:hypothetical protein
MRIYTVKYTASIGHHHISSKAKESIPEDPETTGSLDVHKQVRCRSQHLPDENSMKILEEIRAWKPVRVPTSNF